MKNDDFEHDFSIDRRSLLVGGVTVFGGWALLGRHAFAQSGKASAKDVAPQRTLLLVELNGGNDGLACVVPWADDVLHRMRTRTGLDQGALHKIDDYRAFHPNLSKLRRVYGDGKMAIIEGAGYPNPNHSHFTSQDIWHTARATGRMSGDGWVGRMMQTMYPKDLQVPHAVHVGQSLPYSLKSATHPIVCFDEPPAYRWAENGGAIADAGTRPAADSGTRPTAGMPAANAAGSRLSQIRSVVRNAKQSSEDVRRAAATYKPRVEYPNDAFGLDLRTAAALLQSNIGCRVLSVAQQGYDTHEDQRRRHDLLMKELDQGLSAFLEDVRGTPTGDNVVVLVFSEFGRRVEDNASIGTDHGTAGPMFLLGTPVKGGLYGKHPSLTELHEGDLIHTTDFRSVYASVLELWFGLDSAPILGGKYAPIQGCFA
jgi:uncharacterized protein (DUF1501 family)